MSVALGLPLSVTFFCPSNGYMMVVYKNKKKNPT